MTDGVDADPPDGAGSAAVEGRYPPPASLPPGVLRFGIVSVAAAALFGGGGAVIWLAFGDIPLDGDLTSAFDFVLNFGLTIPIMTAIGSVAPVLAAIIAGLLARRMHALLARASVVTFAVALTTGLVLSVVFWPPADGIAWELVIPPTTIAALGLATSAVLPWRGGFASRRYEKFARSD